MRDQKSIWRSSPTLKRLNAFNSPCMVNHLGITFTEVGPDYLKATMPVDHRTIQPMGILHGGASVVLAETLGSVAGTWCLDSENEVAVGLAINANHIRAVPAEALVTGVVRPVHRGRSTHVWEIHITDEQERLVCVSRLTLAIVPRKK